MTTRVVNLVGGPGVGKTVMASLIFAEIKIRQKTAELAPEYAKRLVWMKEFEMLDDQYMVSTEQYKLIRSMNGKVDYIVTDGPLFHGLYYNRYNKNNTSNVELTEKRILRYMGEFKNITIYLVRGDYAYETEGRQQKTVEEAVAIDIRLRSMLDEHKIEYKAFMTNKKNVSEMVDYIMSFE